MHIEEAFVAIADRPIRYLEAGAGWPLILLHAFPLCADMWRPQLERAPEGWRLLAPDLRGFGPSATAAARTLSDMAEDVLAWMDALDLDDATIAGLSMGGAVTLTMFAVAPERFTAMILANARAAADTEEGKARRDQLSQLVRASGARAIADEMLPKLLGATTHRDRPHLAPMLRPLIEGNSVDGIDGGIQAMRARPDNTPLLPRVGRPALVIAGEEDALIPLTESETMQRLLPRSQLIVLPRAGHLSNVEVPDEFSTAVSDFLHSHL